MEDTHRSGSTGTRKDAKLRVFLAFCLPILIHGAYLYHLLREQFSWMIQRQTALETLKAFAVPGSQFMNNLGSLSVFKGSLFFLLLLGCMLAVFLAFSLLLPSPWYRISFLAGGFLILILLTFRDRVHVSFPLIASLSLASFYVLTLHCRIRLAWKDVLIVLALAVLISGSLHYGTRHKFFVKFRDRILFDTTLGNRIISLYYTYSPLAASLISPEKGVYQGLIFYDEAKGNKPLYLGHGIFVTGEKGARHGADFVILKDGDGLSLVNRFGESLPIESLRSGEIEKAVDRIFTMKGFLRLTSAGLYFFPAGILILCLLGIKGLTGDSRIFAIFGLGLGLLLLVFIWTLSHIGNRPPDAEPLKSLTSSRHGLSAAYYLDRQRRIPEKFGPVVKMMAESDSAALRYWGARLLGKLGDRNQVPRLMVLLRDPCLNIRYVAALSLYRLLKEESFSPLVKRLVSDPSWYVRCKIFSIFLKAGVIPASV